MSRYSGPADPGTPCTFVREDKTVCGGPTYTFASGSIWCPDEDTHPGGYFVKRVAFERSPLAGGPRPSPFKHTAPDWRNEKPRRQPRVAEPRRASEPTQPVERESGFDTGMDGFVRSES